MGLRWGQSGEYSPWFCPSVWDYLALSLSSQLKTFWNTPMVYRDMSALHSVILAQHILQATGARYALIGPVVRVLGAISLLSENGARATYGSVQQLLGLAEPSTVHVAASTLAKRGFITRERGEGIIAGASTSLRLTANGQIVLATLARVERELIAGIGTVEVGTWKKRKYIRSGKFTKTPPAV